MFTLNARTYRLWREKKEKIARHLVCMCVVCPSLTLTLFPSVVCLAQRGKSKCYSCVRKWSKFLLKRNVFFFLKVNGKKKLHFVRSLARARVYIFYTSEAILNAPDENLCTRVVRTHVCVCLVCSSSQRECCFLAP